LAAKAPLAGILSDIDVRPLAEIRRQIRPRLAWNVLLMKAYAQVAARHPELRQLYVGFPWPHIYQHDRNVCMLAVNREIAGEHRLLFARFESPESRPLTVLQQQYDHVREAPVEEIKQFRHQMRFADCPGFVRRIGWWVMTNLWVRKAASHMGTFGMTLSSFKQTFGTGHLGPNTTTLGVDVISRNGISRTLLTFDHRILDGKPAVDILDELGRELRGPILEELRQLVRAAPSPGATETDERGDRPSPRIGRAA
jgi:hypothetical protein